MNESGKSSEIPSIMLKCQQAVWVWVCVRRWGCITIVFWNNIWKLFTDKSRHALKHKNISETNLIFENDSISVSKGKRHAVTFPGCRVHFLVKVSVDDSATKSVFCYILDINKGFLMFYLLYWKCLPCCPEN